MDRFFLITGSLSALVSVAAGAFGAHALKDRLPADLLEIFETAARYQMYHALGLLAAAWMAGRWPGTATWVAGWGFLIGTLVFSGSLYLLALSGQRGLGAVTPLGGVAFMVGWVALAWAAWRGAA